jgi:hypothetical protein
MRSQLTTHLNPDQGYIHTYSPQRVWVDVRGCMKKKKKKKKKNGTLDESDGVKVLAEQLVTRLHKSYLYLYIL